MKKTKLYTEKQVDHMMNTLLNGILCTKTFIVKKDSNSIAEFIIEYLNKHK